jgi:hypothetical protein
MTERLTTSRVVYNIDVNFPVAGQDNDTQTFRDNFDTIYNGLYEANRELTDLLENTSKTDTDNSFNYKLISEAYTQNFITRKRQIVVTSANREIDFEQGQYQIVRIQENSNLVFRNFPTLDDPDINVVSGVGKVTLEIYLDTAATENKTIIFTTEGGTVFKKNSTFPVVGANPQITLSSKTNPVIIEVWQHDSDNIFLNYLGSFS